MIVRRLAWFYLWFAICLAASCSPQAGNGYGGRCHFNADCAAGFECVQSWCENMFYPSTQEGLYGVQQGPQTIAPLEQRLSAQEPKEASR